MKSKLKFGLLALCTMLVFPAAVQAVSIPLGDSGWALLVRPELIEGGQVAYPYIYGVTDDAVVIQLDKVFNRPFSQYGFNYPIIVEFEKLSANATLKIIIEDELVINKTGREWTDYHMHLMVDVLDPEAGFDPNINFIPDGDQFENVGYASNSGYNNLPIDLHFIDTDGNGVLYTSGENWFQPGWWDGRIVIVTDPEMDIGDFFGLKEIPTAIPEPATLTLLGVASIWIFIRKKQRFLSGFRSK
jgi:hypothetical protein